MDSGSFWIYNIYNNNSLLINITINKVLHNRFKPKAKMNNPQIKIEEGGWTPALRQMATEIMDDLMMRPISVAVSDPRNGSVNTFQGIRDKLTKKKYNNLNDWKLEVLGVFIASKNTEEPFLVMICDELERSFMKKYVHLEECSNFRFQSAITSVIDEIELSKSRLSSLINKPM